MKRIFQDKFGYPTGNCFNAAVASILELDSIPDIDPTTPEDVWLGEWSEFFTERGLHWHSRTSEPEVNNWDGYPAGAAIGHVEVAPGILHAIVFEDGSPVHDVMPGSPFLALSAEQQRAYRIVSWSYFTDLKPGEAHEWIGVEEKTDFVPRAVS